MIFPYRAFLKLLAIIIAIFSTCVVFAKQADLQIVLKRGSQHHSILPQEFSNFDFQDGDELRVISKKKPEVHFLKTPDGHLHIKTSPETAIRIPSKIQLTPFHGYFLPEHLSVLTGAGTHTFEGIGQKHVSNYIKYMGLWPEMTFLEIGCGIGRDAFQLLSYLNLSGKYIGIDVTHDSISWLQKHITTQYPHFQFYHFDAAHELYNPLGSKTSLDFKLPTENATIDRLALGSVFTHLFKEEVLHYLKEIKRVLKPQGLAYAAFFLYEEQAIQASRQKSATPFNLRFEHPFGEGCYVNDPIYKTGAVAYTYEEILAMLDKAGLKLMRPLIRGCWSGLFQDSDDGQDVAILGHAECNDL